MKVELAATNNRTPRGFKRKFNFTHRNKRITRLCNLGIPQLASLVEGAGDDLVPPGVVERDRVHHVAVPIQCQQFVSGRGVPHLAGDFMAASRT